MSLQPPPFGEKPLDANGRFSPRWRDWFTSAQSGVALGAAPFDATYLITSVNTELPDAINLGALTAGYVHLTVALGVASVKSGFAAATQKSPSDPTGTASTVGLMMGLAGTITPTISGRVQVTISGTIFNATAIADGAKVQIRTGTGSAPANGDALTGTTAGGLVQYVTATTAEKAPFCLSALVQSLSLNVAVWIDVGLAAITGGTATISDLSIVAVEC